MTLKPNFIAALIAYTVLALVAALTLDGTFRILVWIFLAGLAVKTAIARAAGW